MKNKLFVPFLLIALVLSACNLPGSVEGTPTSGPDAAFTMAVQTVEAQLTQQALLNPTATNIPPTEIPLPTATTAVIPTTAPVVFPTSPPVSSCDSAVFVTDVTVPDNTVLTPGQVITKTWRLRNTGTCTWSSSYSIVFSSGSNLGATSPTFLSGAVAPGATVDISVPITGPTANGDYYSYWELRNPANANMLRFYALIKVTAGSGSSSSSSSGSSSSSAGPFAVTSVGMSTNNICGNFITTANVTVNGPGTVNYTWKWSDSASGPSGTIVFSGTGTQTRTINTDPWIVSTSGSYWAKLYIDSPNHQLFDAVNFNCP